MGSSDRGTTWSVPQQASLRPGHRDGMPVPVILADQRLVFAIEDNGLTGPGRPFRPSIVDPDTKDRWPALATPPPPSDSLAAPYLVRLPSGDTILSVQCSQSHPDHPRMAVYVGNPQARNFTHHSHPFGLDGSAARWNSLCVVNDDTILALASTRIRGTRGLWAVTGRVVRDPVPASR